MPNINVATGEFCHADVDFVLPGIIPIEFKRNYRSSLSTDRGVFGFAWRHPLDLRLLRTKEKEISFVDAEGERTPFDISAAGSLAVHSPESLSEMTLGRAGTEIVLSKADGTRLHFLSRPNPSGVFPLCLIADRNGNAIKIENNQYGNPIRITDTYNRSLVFRYLAGSLIQTIDLIDRENTSVEMTLASYQYDSGGNLIAATNALGYVVRYQYIEHLMVRYDNRNLEPCFSAFDDKKRCVRIWREGNVRARTYDYDEVGKRTIVTDSLGLRTIFKYNEANFVVEEIDPLGGVKQTIYDEKNNFLMSLDEAGTSSLITQYDPITRKYSQIHPSGAIELFEYNEFYEIKRYTDSLGRTWHNMFDERGNPTELHTPLGAIWQYQYDERGLLRSVIAPNGQCAVIERTSDKLRGTISDQHGGVLSFTFSYPAYLAEVTDALGNRTVLSYDRGGQLIHIQYPDGSAAHYKYDGEGNLTEYVDEMGRSIHFSYGFYGVCTEKIDALGHSIKFEYDTELNLRAVINQKGERSTFTYDASGRLVNKRFFDGRSLSYFHDNRGNVISVRDDNSEGSAAISYNSANQVAVLDYGSNCKATYDYDLTRHLKEAALLGSRIDWQFDEEGRLVQETRDDYRIAYAYDAIGNRVHMEDTRGFVASYEYDLRSRLIKLINRDGGVHHFEYDLLDRVISHTMPNGCEEILSYHVSGGLESKRVFSHSGRLIHEQSYVRDRMGRVVETQEQDGTNVKYDYDEIGRLVSVLRNGEFTEYYAYDVNSNLVSTLDYPEIRYASGNRVSRIGDTSYHYDSEGNLESINQEGRGKQYVFGLSSLRQILSSDIAIAEFEYDPLGRRIAAKYSNLQKQFFWDQHSLLREELHKGEQTDEIEYMSIPGQYSPLEKRVSGQYFYYILDHRGAPNRLLDEDGQVVWTPNFTAFGELLESSRTDMKDSIRLPGQYDDGTGLHYNQYRYYDPKLGRYISQDPLGLLGGMNFYQYAPDPVNYIDPLGLLAIPPGMAYNGPIACTPNPNPNNCPPSNPPANPTPPLARGCLNAAGNLRGGGGPAHNQAIQSISNANNLQNQGDFRVNQQQVTSAAIRVGRNRPDIQVTIANQRNYIEVDTPPAPRADCHRYQICNNDPSGVVHLITI